MKPQEIPFEKLSPEQQEVFLDAKKMLVPYSAIYEPESIKLYLDKKYPARTRIKFEPVEAAPAVIDEAGAPREGSRKHEVWRAWKKNPDDAFTVAHKLGLKPASVRSWIATWSKIL